MRILFLSLIIIFHYSLFANDKKVEEANPSLTKESKNPQINRAEEDISQLVEKEFNLSPKNKKDSQYYDEEGLNEFVESLAVTPELKMIKPLIKLSIKASFALLKEGVETFTDKFKFCKRLCQTLARVQCSYKNGVSHCKSVCTKQVRLGSGYTVKIRYQDTFNLQKCILNGIKFNAHTQKLPKPDILSDFQGNPTPSNDKFISIYSENDLKLASQIIGQIRAYDLFILNNGHLSSTRGKSAEEILKLVKVAKKERTKLEENFLKYVVTTFGPQ